MSDLFRRSSIRLLGVVSLAVLLAAACSLGVGSNQSVGANRSAGLAVSVPSLGSASTFAVLGGPTVTLTDSVVTGDVGAGFPLALVTNTRSVINGNLHEGDSVAISAYADFLSAYTALGATPNPTDPTHQLTGTLAGVTLGPGVYSFGAAATLTGVLTLDAQGDPNAVWVFKVGISGTGALTGTGFSVVMANGGDPCNVYWWVAQAATLTTSNFQGTILAGAAITVTGGTFNGDALATAAVTLTGANIAGCTSGSTVPPIQLGSIKVTGGGQIPVPSPDSSDPAALGSGGATFGFNAQPDKSGAAKGHFNYLNHVTGLHINGDVNNIVVIETNADGSAKTVLFSGTSGGDSFIVTVQDNGEPGVNDQLGILVSGSQSEARSMRVIDNGNIQFHK